MSDIVKVQKKARNIEKSQKLPEYSKVVIILDEDTEIAVGDDTGSTLELTCPWGTQEMAETILANLQGYRYTGYSATGTYVDPSVELGDAVSANGIYSAIYKQGTTFGHDYYSDLSAPIDEQIDHEYEVTNSTERTIIRKNKQTKNWAESEFRIRDEEISAKVSQTGGTASSFAWSLISTAFTLTSNNKTVFICNSSGIEVDGKITARSGYIGNGTNGFSIGNTAINNGMTSLDDTTNNGIFLGTNGIALGKGNFKVTSAGVLTAKSGYIGNGTNGFTIGNTYIRNGVESMTDTAHDGIYLGTNGIRLGKGVFTVSSAGKLTCSDAEITGKLVANTGNIGSSTGFTISTNKLYKNQSSYDGSASGDSAGVYVGTDGIGLGKGNFFVKSNGELTAKSGKFEGTVYLSKLAFTDTSGNTVTINGSNITDGTVADGKISGLNGSKLTSGSVGETQIGSSAVTEDKIGSSAVTNSKIGGNAVTKGKTSNGVQTSLDNGDAAKDKIDDLVAGRITATNIKAEALTCDRLFVKRNDTSQQAAWMSTTISGTTIAYLGRQT